MHEFLTAAALVALMTLGLFTASRPIAYETNLIVSTVSASL